MGRLSARFKTASQAASACVAGREERYCRSATSLFNWPMPLATDKKTMQNYNYNYIMVKAYTIVHPLSFVLHAFCSPGRWHVAPG